MGKKNQYKKQIKKSQIVNNNTSSKIEINEKELEKSVTSILTGENKKYITIQALQSNDLEAFKIFY